MADTNGADPASFSFPVIAWAPEPATGDPFDDGTREILTLRDLTTIYFPETDLRLHWTFVDAEGRSWEAVSSRVVGRADAWWTRALPKWLYHPRYRLALEFAERPPAPFDKVKSRLFAAVTANPEAYRDGYGADRRKQLRGAKSLSDLIKSEEALAIERLEPSALGWQWLLWEGRCSRLGFLIALAGIVGAWVAMGWIGFKLLLFLATLIASGAFGMSAIVRRLHDLRLSGWWMVPWFAWTFFCAEIHDIARDTGGPIVAGWLWWIPNLFILGFLALWPGTPGPNRYGFASRGDSSRTKQSLAP